MVGLLTTINRDMGRVAMHAVREELLDAQAAAADVPLRKVHIPHVCTNADYERAMGEAMARARAAGIEGIATDNIDAVTCRKCLTLMHRKRRERRGCRNSRSE